MDVIELSTEFWNVKISLISILQTYSTTDALAAILKILRKLTGNICVGVSFQYNFR